MSGTHIDKTNSIVLKRCYETLVGADSRALWLFLRQKHLPRHIYHELLLEERELTKQSDDDRLASFYYDAFELLHTMTFQDYDPSEAERYMQQYFLLKPAASNAEHLMIEGRLLRQRITNLMNYGKLEEGKLLKPDLVRLEAIIDDSIPPLPIAQFYLACAQYYKVIEIDTERQRSYLNRTLAIFEQHRDEFLLEDIVLLFCKIADTYYQESKFQFAYEEYQKVIPKHPEIFRAQYFFTSTYAQLAMLCSDFSGADRILEEYYGSLIRERTEGQPLVMASILQAKRFLLERKPEQSKPFIDLGFTANDKGLFISFDIELRRLETIYFILSGDVAFGDSLIDKHLKFLQSKKISGKTSQHARFFKLLRAILDERSGGKPISTEMEAALDEFSSGFMAIYGRLLRLVRNI
jgi:hypothetical protein